MKPKSSKYSLLRYILVAFNIFFAILLVFVLLASLVPPTISAFFSVFALLSPPILMVNILFVILWAFWRKKIIFLSLILLILGYQTIRENFQIGSGSSTEEYTLKLTTYNLQRFGLDIDTYSFGENKDKISQFLADEKSDIYCLQEFHGKGTTLYEPLQQMKTKLGAEDYYYESYFNPRFNQLTGLVIFSAYDAINKGKLKFDGSRTFGIYTDLIINKDTVRVFNIHLASIQLMPSDIDFVINPGKDEETFSIHALKIYDKLNEAFMLREQQMDFLLVELEKSPYPILLAGDFNDTPSSYIYNRISSELKDTFVKSGSGFSITYAGRIPFLRIDFIMAGETFSIVDYKRHRFNSSDHFPISAKLMLNDL